MISPLRHLVVGCFSQSTSSTSISVVVIVADVSAMLPRGCSVDDDDAGSDSQIAVILS